MEACIWDRAPEYGNSTGFTKSWTIFTTILHCGRGFPTAPPSFCMRYLLGDGCLQRDICDLSYISKQTINSSIRRLEQDGYLYLQPGRGRDMHICLTPEGRRLVEEKAAPVAAMEERAFSGMPQEDQQALLRLTHAYLARLRAEAGRIL